MHRRVFLLLYFTSGAAALLYEVVWLRLLTLAMGHTARAVGLLLAAFMGGLAAGAWAAGRRSSSMTPARALRSYAALEAAIGAYALVLPLLLASARPLLQQAYADGGGGWTYDSTLAALAVALLSIPTAAMGATYPLAVRWMEQDRSDGAASALYAVNTVGAALGAGLTGFLLLPAFGIRGTTAIGVGLNAIAAAGALLLARRRPAERVAHALQPSESAPRRQRDAAARGAAVGDLSPRRRLHTAAVALGVSGLVALVYQVTWTRTLAMVLGPTSYAFSAIVVAAIAGLAIGSAAVAARAPRLPQRATVWLGLVMIAGAAAAMAAAFSVDRLPLVVASLVSRPDVTFGLVLALQAALVVAIQLPMAIASGAAFALATTLVDSNPQTAPRDVSIVYAANTVGAIAGAVVASFVLIPMSGLQDSIRLAALAGIFTGVAVSWSALRGWDARAGVVLAGTAVIAMALAAPAWNENRLANGAYRYATALGAGDVEAGLEAGRLVYYREGAAGTVSVRDVPGARSLAIDGKVDASNAGDMLTQKLLAHLPLLLHPSPRQVCIIGLGSGVTLGASLTHPIESAEVVEIAPEVVEAAAFFAAENHDALADSRTRLVLGDGRSHLLFSRGQYDVIISEPSNPWMAGVATLFTREFFLAARARLAPGGLFTQWAHTYSISPDDLQSIVATFLSVFPDGTAWLVAESDLLLVGGTGPISTLDTGLSASWGRPGVATDLAEVSVRDPFSVLSMYLAGGSDLQRYAAGAVVQSDDHLPLEYSAPRALYGSFQRTNVAALRQVAQRARQPAAVAQAHIQPPVHALRDRGLMQLQAGAAEPAYADLRDAVRRAPADAEALRSLARAAARLGRLEEVEKLLSELAYGRPGALGPGAEGPFKSGASATVSALVELSFVRAVLGRGDDALAAARDAVLADPTDRAALVQLTSMYADAGNEEGLEGLAQVAGQPGVDERALLYCQTQLAYVRGDFARAVERGQRLAALDPADANVRNLLGSAYAALGQYDQARQALEASLRLTPTDPGVLVNLGTVALRAGVPTVAAERFSEALFLSPTHPGALSGLADALDRQGRSARAAEVRSRLPSP